MITFVLPTVTELEEFATAWKELPESRVRMCRGCKAARDVFNLSHRSIQDKGLALSRWNQLVAALIAFVSMHYTMDAPSCELLARVTGAAQLDDETTITMIRVLRSALQ